MLQGASRALVRLGSAVRQGFVECFWPHPSPAESTSASSSTTPSWITATTSPSPFPPPTGESTNSLPGSSSNVLLQRVRCWLASVSPTPARETVRLAAHAKSPTPDPIDPIEATEDTQLSGDTKGARSRKGTESVHPHPREARPFSTQRMVATLYESVRSRLSPWKMVGRERNGWSSKEADLRTREANDHDRHRVWDIWSGKFVGVSHWMRAKIEQLANPVPPTLMSSSTVTNDAGTTTTNTPLVTSPWRQKVLSYMTALGIYRPAHRASNLYVSWRYLVDGTKGVAASSYSLTSTAHRRIVGPARNLLRLAYPVVWRNYRPVPRAFFDVAGVDLSRTKLLVFLGKRPLSGEWKTYERLLKFINAEHVGVKVISLHHWFGEKVIYFDFLPALDGDTSKFSGEVDAKIQENLLDPEEWAFVGASTSTLKELKKFNEQYMKKYSLGKSDCRDYASSLCRFLTKEDVPPGMITTYIHSALSKYGKSSVNDVVEFVRAEARKQRQAQSWSTWWYSFLPWQKW